MSNRKYKENVIWKKKVWFKGKKKVVSLNSIILTKKKKIVFKTLLLESAELNKQELFVANI